MAVTEAPAAPGHNQPPPYDPDKLEELTQRVEKFMETCNEVRAAGEITTEESAEHLTDLISGLTGLKKEVEATRRAEKKPYDDAGKVVQGAFTPLTDHLDRAAKAMKDLHFAYQERKRIAAEEEQRRQKAEADRLAKEAEETAREAAARGNIDAEIEAEQLAKEAAKASKVARRKISTAVGSATGAGRTISTRTVRQAQIDNISLLFIRFREHPRLIECLQALANAEVRSDEITQDNAAIFGITITETRTAA